MTKECRLYKYSVILLHALVGWAYCGALRTALIVHAVGAPFGFVLISRFYFRRFAFTTPLQTAGIFLAVVAALDFVLVAPVFEKSYAVFTGVLGTWRPFVLIFTTSYSTGLLTRSGHPDRPN